MWTVISPLVILGVVAIIVLWLLNKSQGGTQVPTPPAPTPPSPGQGQHLTLVVQTKNVLPADVVAYIDAQNEQLSADFDMLWNVQAYIDEQPGGWPVYLIDNADVPGALGYHDVDASGTPYAKVFVLTSQQGGVAWQSVASHEVLETMADPTINKTVTGPDGCQWDVEACDPVEDVSYMVNGVPMSDFVDPAWFQAGSKGPWDFQQELSAPFTITSGGYAMKTCNGQPVQIGGQWRARHGAP